MTFLMDPDDTHIFMQSDALDFQKAVQPFTSKAGQCRIDSPWLYPAACCDGIGLWAREIRLGQITVYF